MQIILEVRKPSYPPCARQVLSLLRETQKLNKRSNRMYYSNLLLSMLRAVATRFDCRRPAFWKCAVAIPTMLFAGHDLAVDHLAGAA